MSRLSSIRGAWKARLMAVVCLLLAAPLQTILADGDVPVTASLAVSPSAAERGIIELKLKLVITGAWHVYGSSPGAGGEQPMRLKLQLPEGMEPVGDWVWPARADLFTAGEHVFTHKLKLAGLKGKAAVDVTVMYQACDPQMCLPPDMLLLEAEVEAASAADVDPRTERISGFLK